MKRLYQRIIGISGSIELVDNMNNKSIICSDDLGVTNLSQIRAKFLMIQS